MNLRRPKAGDLLFFSACTKLGILINLGTIGIPGFGLSHAAILACHPSRPGTQPLVFESTMTYNEPCVIQGRNIDGVQAHYLFPRVRNYPGKVWLYPLAVPLTEEQSARLSQFCFVSLGTSYDKDGAVRSRFLGLGWLGRLLYNREDLTSLFCSEFQVSCLNRLRLTSQNASGFNPNAAGRFVLRKRICTRPRRMK